MSGPLSNPYMFKSAAGATDYYSYQIANSVRLNGSNQYFNRTASSASTNSDKKAISVWYKRAGGTGNTAANYIISSQQDRLAALFVNDGSTADNAGYFTDNGGQNGKGKFLQRDFNAWYHLVFLYDSTLSTGVDRVKFYINGVHYTTADTTFWNIDNNGYPNSGAQIGFGMQSNDNNIGRYQYNGSGYFNGYLADFIMIDGGTVPSISDFGETKNGVWVPKDPSGLTFGTNGFWLKFESGSDLGNDSSGNNNDWTANNFSAHDQMLDSPTFNSSSNGGNFATYNPLNAGSNATLSEGNLKVLGNTSSDIAMPSGTFAMTSGKWYFERLIANESSGYPYLGLAAIGNVAYNTNTGGDIWAMRFAPASGTVAANGTAANVAGFGTITATSTGLATATTGDIIGFHLDLDNRKCWITKNGAFVNSGDPSAGTNPQWSWTATPNNPISFIDQIYNGTGSILNAGQDGTFAGNKTAQGNSDDTGYGNFYYAPDTGFLAMCSGNLPTNTSISPAETNDNYPQKLFGAILYTGNGGTNNITGLGFQPDWTWIKERGGANDHKITDSTRGVTKAWESNTSNAFTTDTNGLTAFGTDGFTVGSDAVYNNNTDTYVAWNWRLNGGTTAVNTVGGTSSVTQVDPSGGISVVTYTGFAGASGSSTVGHGMSVAPEMVITLSTNGSGWWTQVPSVLTNAGYFLNLNSTGAETDLNSYGTMNAPTTSVFTINGVEGVGGSSRNYVAYCFANIEGFCKVGSYIGNGNADGTFIYLGFRPAFILIKDYSGLSADWVMYDNKREGYNVTTIALAANLANADQTSNRDVDILSNGFKFRTSNGNVNSSGGNYMYLAIAKNPFQFATAR